MAAEDLESLPVEEIEVKTQPSALKTKVGDKAFIDEFVTLVKTGPVWRSLKGLAGKLGVDPIDLMKWCDLQPALVRRPGKEDGTLYYAASARLEAEAAKKSDVPPGMERKHISEEDRYVIGILHVLYNNYLAILQEYAMHMHGRNAEAFVAFMDARDRMSAAISLYANKLGIDMTKLPKM